MEPGFRDLVHQRLGELSTLQLIAERDRVSTLRRYVAETGNHLLTPDGYEVWNEGKGGDVEKDSHTEYAWALCRPLAEEMSAQVRNLKPLNTALDLHGDDDGVTWALRGRYEISAYLISALGSELFMRLAKNGGGNPGELPKLANVAPEDRAFLRTFRELRNSFEHWDERMGKGASKVNKDQVSRMIDEETVRIGRLTDEHGRPKLTYMNGSELIVDISPAGADRINSIVDSAERSIRITCSSDMTRFFQEFAEARWLGGYLGSALSHRPFRSSSA